MLHVDLQEGFENDAVLLRLDDRTIYEQTGVSTDMRTNRADAVEVPLVAGSSTLSVSLPDRDIAGSIVLALSDSLHVGISIQEGSVKFTVSDQPFGYL